MGSAGERERDTSGRALGAVTLLAQLIHVDEANRLWFELISIPLFTGVIGYITNWTGVLMLFEPLRYHGVAVPGLKLLFPFLPRRLQIVPVFSKDGRLGWQGIVPSRVDKMASIATDKALSKVGSISDFYRELEPNRIAERLLDTARGEVRGLVEDLMEREHPKLWHDMPPALKDALFARVDAQLPTVVTQVTDEIGNHLDQLIDAKLMVIRYFRKHPELMNSVFRDIGRKELRFMQNFGFYFGVPMGFLLVWLVRTIPHWWVLPVGGVIIGYVVNYLGIQMIFEPVLPHKLGPFTVQGLFLKRQPEASDVFAAIIAENVITIENIADEILYGPRSDRTHQMLEDVLRPTVDKALGRAQSTVRAAIGSREYERIRDSVAIEAAGFTTALFDPEFSSEQAEKIRTFVARQMRKLSPEEFSELLRSAIKSDEWLLFVHGAVLGFGAGLLHLAVFGV
ncbi:MAG: hypothetical protein IT198_15630 [Acidimicrobiia bacterium]|nr:hypothetical protein [Acidimicrobiia bacterium]